MGVKNYFKSFFIIVYMIPLILISRVMLHNVTNICILIPSIICNATVIKENVACATCLKGCDELY